MGEQSPLNPAALERLRKLGGDKFLVDMINLFLSYGSTKVAEARRAHQAGNLVAVADAAHPIKSSAGNVGAERLQQAAMSLEQSAKEGRAADVAAQVDELETAYAQVKGLLETELARLKP